MAKIVNACRLSLDVHGGAIPASLGARILADVWDQNAVLYATSPINARLEETVEQWLRDLLGLPEETVAGYVSGTSMAIVCGLAAARFRLLQKAGWDVNKQGLDGAPHLRIVTGRHTHGTVIKAVNLLGFGADRIEMVDVDSQGRIIAEAAPDLDDRTILILQAGNVNSESFDPLRTLCEKANAVGAWTHIDGAFGLWAALSYLGRAGVDQLVFGLHERAVQFADELRAEGFEILNDVVFNQVLVASKTDAIALKTIDHLQASGEAWAGGSKWFDRAVIRVSACSWATDADDVSRSVRAFVAAREAAQNAGG